MAADKLKTFYVYVYRDPRPGKDMQPLYVGKGKQKRAREHWWKADKHKNPFLRGALGKMREAGLEPIIEIVGYFEIEADAFQREIALIAQYGRRNLNTGTLCNLTDGGEGPSGSLGMRKRLQHDSEFAKRHTERGREQARKLNADPNVAKARGELGHEAIRKLLQHDPEFAKARADLGRDAMRKLRANPKNMKAQAEAMSKLWSDPGYVKTHSERTSERSRKLWSNPQFVKKQTEAMRKLRADPEYAKALSVLGSNAMSKLHADPDFAKAHAARGRESMRKLNANPEFAKKNAERARKRLRKLHTDAEFQARRAAGHAAYYAKLRGEIAR